MNKKTVWRILKTSLWAAMALVLAVAVVGSVAADDVSSTSGSSTVAVDLPTGGWVAYAIDYAGDQSILEITARHSPVDDAFGAEDITLEVYGPESLPPDGTPIGIGSQPEDLGLKYCYLQTDIAGQYVILINNWTEHPISVEIAVSGADETTVVPMLYFVSSGQPDVSAS